MNDTKYILDVCCGGRTFWFDKNNPHAIYQDKRIEQIGFIECRPNFKVVPDLLANFKNLPYADGRFKMVVYDPPHLLRAGNTGWQKKKYGVLAMATWREDLLHGFNECWRVLENYGTLIFKWNECSTSFKEVLELFPVRPLFGHPTARSGMTKWFCFMKIPSSA